jgi:peptidoglycan/LPS O-acetylase OafA/YrhL
MSLPSNARKNLAGKFQFADALRGPAALCVVAAHFIPHVSTMLPVSAWHMVGQLGVAVFFLVSGFVIPISLSRYTVGGFLIARGLRIYPTYIVALTITLISIWAERAIPQMVWGVNAPPVIHDTSRYLANYLIASNIFGQPPLDGVVWTLQIELHFYVLCAVVAPLIRSFSPALLLAPVGLLVAQACAQSSGLGFPMRISGEFPFLGFMFGGVAAYYFVNGKLSATALFAYLAASAGLFSIAWWYGLDRPNAHLSPAYAAATAIFVAAMFWGGRLPSGLMSRISYSIYVVHIGIGILALKVCLWNDLPPDIAAAAALSCTIGTALLVHFLVEAPTHRLGQRVARGLAAANWRTQEAPAFQRTEDQSLSQHASRP